ncbi:MAG TPA: SGNH/GDSL hydrolase family protein [Dyella sp.]|uniref:SGNH/GDSL hydrolase family protein n=1 Tax=Dyella sp. TaxID=1869338 RepID=UPI002D14D928|nr:SGNH/GDSL hydrolase family protein [Dyella sp.]HTV85011.1 SGNH/GDSL hydrolase family protein [Dyella sp.]
MKRTRKDFKRLALFAALVCAAACLQTHAADQVPRWIATWGAAQQTPEPRNALPAKDLQDATVRQIFHLSVAGRTLRVKVSNAFGTAPLHFTSVHIARPLAADAPAIDPASDRALSFAGAPDVLVPAGAEYLSDPIDYPVDALSNLAVTFHLDNAPQGETGHPGSRATTYLVHGNAVGAANFSSPEKVDHWYQIAEIDVQGSPQAGTVVTLGDSITDGHASTTNGNDRWPDVLARRLQQSPATRALGVVNKGIGGNRLLIDGLGPNALARFDRDVLAPAGVRWLIVLEGVNDLGTQMEHGDVSKAQHEDLTHRIIAAYQQIIDRAHAHGIRVTGGTITPFGGSMYDHPGTLTEAERQAINAWIRAPGHFDSVVDFDAVVRDPHHPERLLPAYDCGDHLHPSPVGYRAMGEAIPLTLFER